MATAAHTPGPWRAQESKSGACVMIFGPGEWKLAEAHSYQAQYEDEGAPTKDTREANARLIAAAPDLLAALQALLGSFESEAGIIGKATVDRARAAIAAATGEP